MRVLRLSRVSDEELEEDFQSGDPNQPNDLRVEMNLKNNILWKAIYQRHVSLRGFCQEHSLMGTYPTIGSLLRFKISPFSKQVKGLQTRQYLPTCLKLEKILGLPVEYLFPEELYERLVGHETSKAIEVASADLSALEQRKVLQLAAEREPDPLEQEESKERLEAVLETLTHKEKNILKMRFGLTDGREHTLEELTQVFGVNRERIRQIERRAILKMRQPLRWDRLKSLLDP